MTCLFAMWFTMGRVVVRGGGGRSVLLSTHTLVLCRICGGQNHRTCIRTALNNPAYNKTGGGGRGWTRSTIGRGRGYNKFVPVLGGNSTKIVPTGDIF